MESHLNGVIITLEFLFFVVMCCSRSCWFYNNQRERERASAENDGLYFNIGTLFALAVLSTFNNCLFGDVNESSYFRSNIDRHKKVTFAILFLSMTSCVLWLSFDWNMI